MCSRMRTLAAASCMAAAAAADELILGVSYSPAPVLSVADAALIRQDDWFCDEAVRMWGKSGRGDLRVMRQLGANMVRLYGNNPENDHTNFLDEAWAEGLSVAPGMSDWPYRQQVPGRCQDTNYNCFEQVKQSYKMNLQKGFLKPDGSYHPALKYMNILNEADLKMPPDADVVGPEGPKKMGRTLISALDGMLDAEREMNVAGYVLNFTATFSYAICAHCGRFEDKPALGQMWIFEDAVLNPEKYDYSPRNDIAAAYRKRFTHSFNTQNPATDLKLQFLDEYTANFRSTPVYIGEYHRAKADTVQDLTTILNLARSNPLFKGISFFEFQVAYWKDGSERDFGMFGLNDTGKLVTMDYFDQRFDIHCLTAVKTRWGDMHQAVTDVYRGAGVATSQITTCEPNPEALPVTDGGFLEALKHHDPDYTARYVQSVVEHLGGVVPASGKAGLETFSLGYTASSGLGFDSLAASLGGEFRPVWADFDTTQARCAANRGAQPRDVGEAVGWACQHALNFTCEDIPDFCKQSTYKTADWVFSRFYKELGPSVNPLTQCNMSGTAIYASAELYRRWTGSVECLDGGAVPVSTTAAPSADPTSTPEPRSVASTSTSAMTSSAGVRHHDVMESTTAAAPSGTNTQKLFLEGSVAVHAVLPATAALLLVLVQVAASVL